MRPPRVVAPAPALDFDAWVLDAREHLRVQALLAQRAVEALEPIGGPRSVPIVLEEILLQVRRELVTNLVSDGS